MSPDDESSKKSAGTFYDSCVELKTIPKPRIIILSDQIRTNGGVNFKLKHQPDKIVLKILPAQKIVQLTPSKFDFHFKGEYLASRAKG